MKKTLVLANIVITDATERILLKMNAENKSNSECFGHNYCLLCGDRNSYSFGLKFKILDDGRVHTKFKAFEALQGYDNILHGGVTYALLASAMVHCLNKHGIIAVTADANIRFLEPVPCTAEIDLFGEIIEKKRSLYYMKGEIVYKDKLMAMTTARFMKKKA